MDSLTKIIKFLFSLFTWIALPVLIVLAIYSVGANVSVFNGYQTFLVQSGSMEPTIKIGDVVVTHSQRYYFQNDIDTFYSPEVQRIVTHRIVKETGESEHLFSTKGDANREEDEATIENTDIIGKVIFVIPKLGFLINFSQSVIGFTLLIFIPAAGLIFDEVLKMVSKRNNAH